MSTQGKLDEFTIHFVRNLIAIDLADNKNSEYGANDSMELALRRLDDKILEAYEINKNRDNAT